MTSARWRSGSTKRSSSPAGERRGRCDRLRHFLPDQRSIPVSQLVERHWDYSLHAKYYSDRPNYHGAAIDLLVHHVGAKAPGFAVADIGAGTGNLTIMLLERGLRVTAV